MNGGNRGSQACPLCRHQRRRCDGTCEFGQYFPGNRSHEFENAYRLFGVSNMLRIMRSVEPHQRQPAADSILVEGNARSNDPVHGCLGYELNLRSQIESSLRELEVVNQLLAFCREQERLANLNRQMGNSLVATSSSASSIPLQNSQHDGSGTQMPSSGEIPSTGYVGGMVSSGEDVMPFDIQQYVNLMEPYKRGSFPSSHEKGESSTSASKANRGVMIVEEKETEAHDKGKQIIVDDDQEHTEACDKGKNIAYEEDTEAED